MNFKKIVSAATAFALSATMFAGFSTNASAATTQPASVIATSSAQISSGTITATDDVDTDLYIHYYNKALSEAMIAFDLGDGNYYDTERILSATLSTYDWTTSAKPTQRDLNGSLYALSDTTLATKTTTGEALWSTSGKISAYVSATSDAAAVNKQIDVTEYMQSLDAETSAVAFLYTVDTNSICDWRIASENVAGKEPTLLLTYGKKVTLTTKIGENVVPNVPVIIGDKTYTTDENGTVSFAAAAGTYDYTIELSAEYDAKSGSFTVAEEDLTVDIALEEAEVTPCALTLRYVDGEGNEIKSVEATDDAFVDVEYALTDAEKATFEYTVDEVKYRAAVTTTAVTPDAATDTCDVVCDVDKYITVNVNAVGGVEKTLTTISGFEGDSVSYVFPMYVLDNGVVYETSNLSGTYYGTSATLTEGTDVEHTYTQKYENVVLYDELDGSTGNNASVRASNCSAYDNAAYTSSTEIEPGIYTIVARFYNKGRASTMTIGDTVAIDASAAGGSWNTNTYTNVVVTEAAPLVWNAGGSGTYDPIDTVVVIKTGDVPVLTVAYEAPSGVTVETETVDATLVAVDGELLAEEEEVTGIDLTGVQTLYIKVENSNGYVPGIKLADETEISPFNAVSNTIGGDEYYVYQFVGIDLTDAVVTYGDAADVAIEIPTV